VDLYRDASLRPRVRGEPAIGATLTSNPWS
jgi:hypothetical protein